MRKQEIAQRTEQAVRDIDPQFGHDFLDTQKWDNTTFPNFTTNVVSTSDSRNKGG